MNGFCVANGEVAKVTDTCGLGATPAVPLNCVTGGAPKVMDWCGLEAVRVMKGFCVAVGEANESCGCWGGVWTATGE